MALPLLLGAAIASPVVRGAVAAGAKRLLGGFVKKKAVKVASVLAGGVAAGYAGQQLAGGGGGLPALPGNMQLPALQNQAMQAAGVGGLPVPFFKGPGGKLQMPWSDPRIPEYLKQFALDDAYLKVFYRAPKGYIILRDASGRPFAVNKKIAIQAGVYKSPARPPISATDWKNYKRAKSVEKKLLKIAAPMIRKKTAAASARCHTKKK